MLFLFYSFYKCCNSRSDPRYHDGTGYKKGKPLAITARRGLRKARPLGRSGPYLKKSLGYISSEQKMYIYELFRAIREDGNIKNEFALNDLIRTILPIKGALDLGNHVIDLYDKRDVIVDYLEDDMIDVQSRLDEIFAIPSVQMAIEEGKKEREEDDYEDVDEEEGEEEEGRDTVVLSHYIISIPMGVLMCLALFNILIGLHINDSITPQVCFGP